MNDQRGDRQRQTSDYNDSSDTIRLKRSRIAQACTSCRSRKTKCDGKRPDCTSCTYLELDCSFNTASSNATSGTSHRRALRDGRSEEEYSDMKGYINTLESRLSELEARFGKNASLPFSGQSNPPVSPQNGAIHYDNDAGIGYSDAEDRLPEQHQELASINDEGDYHYDSDDSFDDDDECYDMTPGRHSRRTKKGSNGMKDGAVFASCPSTSHFTFLVSKSIGMSEQLPSPNSSDSWQYRNRSTARLSLPEPSKASNLFTFYIQKTHRLYPFVDIEKRRSGYESLYNTTLRSRLMESSDAGCEVALYVALFGLAEQVRSGIGSDAGEYFSRQQRKCC
jgi:hypothetical protein